MKINFFILLLFLFPFVLSCGHGGKGSEGSEGISKPFVPIEDTRENAEAPRLLQGGYNFSVYSPDSKYVSLVGDFNNWIDNRFPMEKNKFGVWTITVPLKKGKYSYKFNIDRVWVIDNNNPNVVKDKTGDQRSIIEVTEDVKYYEEPFYFGAQEASAPVSDRKGILFSYKAPFAAEVTVAGTFNNWEKDRFYLRKNKNGIWSGYIQIPKGEYDYKYCVDGLWKVDPYNPLKVEDGQGEYKSRLTVDEDIEDRPSAPFPLDYDIIRFSFYDKDLPSKYEISVVGNFNGWRTNINLMSDKDFNKEWFTTVRLRAGEYYYKFYLAGREFFDPANKITRADPDGKESSYLEVAIPQDRRNIKFSYKNPSAKHVSLAGDFNNWSLESDPLKKDQYGLWYIEKKLFPGKYVYQYIADGKWMVDPYNPHIVWDMNGDKNSIIEIK